MCPRGPASWRLMCPRGPASWRLMCRRGPASWRFMCPRGPASQRLMCPRGPAAAPHPILISTLLLHPPLHPLPHISGGSFVSRRAYCVTHVGLAPANPCSAPGAGVNLYSRALRASGSKQRKHAAVPRAGSSVAGGTGTPCNTNQGPRLLEWCAAGGPPLRGAPLGICVGRAASVLSTLVPCHRTGAL
jgi:hypothetical protein